MTATAAVGLARRSPALPRPGPGARRARPPRAATLAFDAAAARLALLRTEVVPCTAPATWQTALRARRKAVGGSARRRGGLGRIAAPPDLTIPAAARSGSSSAATAWYAAAVSFIDRRRPCTSPPARGGSLRPRGWARRACAPPSSSSARRRRHADSCSAWGRAASSAASASRARVLLRLHRGRRSVETLRRGPGAAASRRRCGTPRPTVSARGSLDGAGAPPGRTAAPVARSRRPPRRRGRASARVRSRVDAAAPPGCCASAAWPERLALHRERSALACRLPPAAEGVLERRLQLRSAADLRLRAAFVRRPRRELARGPIHHLPAAARASAALGARRRDAARSARARRDAAVEPTRPAARLLLGREPLRRERRGRFDLVPRLRVPRRRHVRVRQGFSARPERAPPARAARAACSSSLRRRARAKNARRAPRTSGAQKRRQRLRCPSRHRRSLAAVPAAQPARATRRVLGGRRAHLRLVPRNLGLRQAPPALTLRLAAAKSVVGGRGRRPQEAAAVASACASSRSPAPTPSAETRVRAGGPIAPRGGPARACSSSARASGRPARAPREGRARRPPAPRATAALARAPRRRADADAVVAARRRATSAARRRRAAANARRSADGRAARSRPRGGASQRAHARTSSSTARRRPSSAPTRRAAAARRAARDSARTSRTRSVVLRRSSASVDRSRCWRRLRPQRSAARPSRRPRIARTPRLPPLRAPPGRLRARRSRRWHAPPPPLSARASAARAGGGRRPARSAASAARVGSCDVV